MLRFLRLALQFSLLPPVNINFNFPPRPWRPPPPPPPPPPNNFDPKRKVSPLEGRVLAASNSLQKLEKGKSL